jgi:hypothetical protein
MQALGAIFFASRCERELRRGLMRASRPEPMNGAGLVMAAAHRAARAEKAKALSGRGDNDIVWGDKHG